MRYTSSGGVTQRECVQGVEYDQLERSSVCVSLNPPTAESQKCISTLCIVSSWLFFYITSLQFPRYTSLQLFPLPHLVYVFSLARLPPQLTVTQRYAGVNCACSSFLWLLPSSKTNPKVNQFSSTTSPITECITMLSLWTTNCFERATLWPTMLCSSQNCHFNLQSAFVNKMKNLNSAGYTPIENIAYALEKIIGLNNIVIKQLISICDELK